MFGNVARTQVIIVIKYRHYVFTGSYLISFKLTLKIITFGTYYRLYLPSAYK